MALFELGKPGLRKSDAAILRIEVLGSISAHMLDGTSVTPTGAKTRGLLAILALSDRRPVSRRTLAGLLWSRRSDEQARASLRQEIHRLADALSPLGADVIDVQRHALALKPVLSTVDVERYLNATPANILKLPEISGALLSDLTNVDPALDEWLAQQRGRLQQHIVASLEQAMIYQSEPDHRLTAASRILKFDRLNENAWKVYLRELARRDDSGPALMAAEECLGVFRDALKAEPGAATMAIIAEVKAMHGGNAVSDPSADGYRYSSDGTMAGDSGQPRSSSVKQSLHRHVALESTCIATIGFAPEVFLGDAAAYADYTVEIGHSMEILLSQFGFLGVIPPDTPLSGSGGQPDDGPSKDSSPDVDFLIERRYQVGHSLTAGESREVPRLVVRVTDQRRNGVLVWARRIDIEPETFERQIVGITTEIIWRVALAEARAVAHRPSGELMPLQSGLRVMALMARANPAVYPEASALIHDALLREPGHPFLLFISGVTAFLQAFEQWDGRQPEYHALARAFMRQLLQVMPENLHGKTLLGRILMNVHEDRACGVALLQETYRPRQGGGVNGLITAYAHMVMGDYDRAFHTVAHFCVEHPTHPVTDIIDLDLLLIALVAGQSESAVSWARARLAATPNRSALLVLYLLALVQQMRQHGTDNSAEIDDVRGRILLLRPGLSVDAIKARLNHLPESGQALLYDLLAGTGLPAYGAADLRELADPHGPRVLGGVTATGYESGTQTGAVVPQQMR